MPPSADRSAFSLDSNSIAVVMADILPFIDSATATDHLAFVE